MIPSMIKAMTFTLNKRHFSHTYSFFITAKKITALESRKVDKENSKQIRRFMLTKRGFKANKDVQSSK